MSDAEIKRLTYDEIIDLRNKRQQEEINKELEKIAEKVAKKLNILYAVLIGTLKLKVD